MLGKILNGPNEREFNLKLENRVLTDIANADIEYDFAAGFMQGVSFNRHNGEIIVLLEDENGCKFKIQMKHPSLDSHMFLHQIPSIDPMMECIYTRWHIEQNGRMIDPVEIDGVGDSIILVNDGGIVEKESTYLDLLEQRIGDLMNRLISPIDLI